MWSFAALPSTAACDPWPTVADVVASEGQAYAEFVFSLSAPASTPLSVNYVSLSGTASSSTDYDYTGSQTVTFAPGQTTQVVRVALVDGTTLEPVESFFLGLSVPSGSSLLLGRSHAMATIIDNDGSSAGTPGVTIRDAVVAQ